MATTNTDIVNTALSFVGKLKYEFGSDNIKGGTGDCSSFTEYVFAVHGLDIGPDTEAQYTQGIAVSKEDIKAGDLILFKNTYNSGKKDGVSHVGIALGNGQFVHLGSKGCKVDSLSGSLGDNYLGARRVRGVTYGEETVDYEVDKHTEIKTPVSTSGDIELVWWGDIVKVVVIILLIVGAVVLLSASMLGGVKVPTPTNIVEEVTK